MERTNKEIEIAALFFNHPSKQWHFSELREKIDIAESKLDKWLKRFVKEGMIMRVKRKGAMPYYIADSEDSGYKTKKRIFAIQTLYDSGLLDYLLKLEGIESIVLFGSFARSDWHGKSDIDLFIYGNPEKIEIGKFEVRLKRDIQIFTGTSHDLNKLGPALLRNIIKGDIIRGDIPKEVIAYAGL